MSLSLTLTFTIKNLRLLSLPTNQNNSTSVPSHFIAKWECLDLNIRFDTQDYQAGLKGVYTSSNLKHYVLRNRTKRRKKSATTCSFRLKIPRPETNRSDSNNRMNLSESGRHYDSSTDRNRKDNCRHLSIVKESLARGQQLLYVTPKNSQHGVPKTRSNIYRKRGAQIKAWRSQPEQAVFEEWTICNQIFGIC